MQNDSKHSQTARDSNGDGSIRALSLDALSAGKLLDAFGSGLVFHDAAARIIDVNRTFLDLSGFDRCDLLELAPPFPYLIEGQSYPAPGGNEQRLRIRRKDGSGFIAAVSVALHEESGGTIVKFRDVTQAQEHLGRLVYQVESSRQRLQELLANVPGVVWEAYDSPDGETQRIDFVSSYVERMLGYSVQEWLSTPNFWLTIVHPDDRERAARVAADAFASGQQHINAFRWIARDGRVLWVESTATVIFDENGKPIGMRGVTMDVSERRLRQRALRRRAKQLERSAIALKAKNAELDQFAYITSHDLRAPLRGIANLSNWIEEDMGDRFTPEAHKQMELLRGRVHRMEALINGLLEFSRIGRAAAKKETIDLNALLRDAIDLLAPPPGVTIHVQAGLPRIVSEKLRIGQVFMNLIGNAIKHRGDESRPLRVDITFRDVGKLNEFTVADDGPGIAPEYHERIFAIFQTLVARDKVEGTGVGLALVKKIVENHGGTIRVESNPALQPGARFIFTWQKELDQHPRKEKRERERRQQAAEHSSG